MFLTFTGYLQSTILFVPTIQRFSYETCQNNPVGTFRARLSRQSVRFCLSQSQNKLEWTIFLSDSVSDKKKRLLRRINVVCSAFERNSSSSLLLVENSTSCNIFSNIQAYEIIFWFAASSRNWLINLPNPLDPIINRALLNLCTRTTCPVRSCTYFWPNFTSSDFQSLLY